MTPRARRRALIPCALLGVVLTAVLTAPAQAVLGSVTARWPATTLTRGTTTAVTGHVSGIELGNGVFLQQRVLGGWRNVARVGLDSARNYRLAIPTWWVGNRTYRVITTSLANSTLLGTPSTSWTVKVVPNYVPSGYPTQHRYAMSTPARWDPCRTIGYRVNTTQATAGALNDTKVAFSRMSQATGFRFAYRGGTTGIPQNSTNAWYPSDTQIVVAWARPAQSPLLRLYPGAEGVGAATSYSGWYNGDGSRTNRIVKGMVVIDSRVKRAGGFGSGLTRGDVLLHELGHALGLAHIGATSQTMYPYLTRGYARLGRGDFNGLEKRGAKLGCVTHFPPLLGRTTITTAADGTTVTTVALP